MKSPGGTMTCLDVEATMSMGVKLFRWLTDGEARCQQLALRGEVPPDDPVWEDIEQAYRSWLLASEKLLIRADEFARDGFDLDGLGEFRTTVDEARSLVALWEFEPQILPIEEALPLTKPQNPLPTRYPT